MVDAIPVCYAMTYVFGTLGAVWLLGYVGPAMMGGLDKVKSMTHELEKTLSPVTPGSDPSSFNACRPIAFRDFKADGRWMSEARSVADIEAEFHSKGKRITVERIKRKAAVEVIKAIEPETVVYQDDIVALAGRREMDAVQVPERPRLVLELYRSDLEVRCRRWAIPSLMLSPTHCSFSSV